MAKVGVVHIKAITEYGGEILGFDRSMSKGCLTSYARHGLRRVAGLGASVRITLYPETVSSSA